MAATTQDLSDEQIDALLREAEVRLASRSASTALSLSEKQTLEKGQDGPKTRQHAGDGDGKTSAEKPAAELTVRTAQMPLTNKEKAAPKEDAGADWYNLPRTDLSDPNMKRNFQILRMRSVLANGKQHFKRDTRRDPIPEFSQMGTIVEGPTEYYSARLTRKERKRDLVEEVLAERATTSKFATRYGKIQERKASGKKAFYKKLMAQRRRGK